MLYDALNSTTYTPGISQRVNGADSFFHSDWLGSTRYLSDSTGNNYPSGLRYDAFGNRTATGGAYDPSPFQFAGDWGYQSEFATGPEAGTGLEYLQNRYYDPAVGRFISQDPVGFGTGTNLYDYVDNDPVSAVDPFGLQDPADYVAPASGLADLRGRVKQFAASPEFKAGSPQRLSYSRFLDTLGPAGLAKQGVQALTGHDPVGGRKVPVIERLVTGALLAIGAVCHFGGGGEQVPGGFRGPAAKGFDWEHIFENHAPWGSVARQSGIKTVFEGLNAGQIAARVKSAWRYRELVETQDLLNGVVRQRYRGVDPVSNQLIEFWFNKTTRVVETAYPVR